jgi:L-rhamnose isomerase / sugar isomerase
MTLSVVNLQEAYAKALLVDREALTDAQHGGDVLGAHELLLDAYRTDVRPLWAKVRVELGATEDPVRAVRESGYLERVSGERGSTEAVAGGWGR